MTRYDRLFEEWSAVECYSDAACDVCPNTVECHHLIEAIRLIEFQDEMSDLIIDIEDLLEEV